MKKNIQNKIKQNEINQCKDKKKLKAKNRKKKRVCKKRKKGEKNYLQKGKNFQHVMKVGAMFINLLKKKINMYLSKACKFEM